MPHDRSDWAAAVKHLDMETLDVLSGLDVSLLSAILTKGTSEMLKACIKHFDAQDKKPDSAETPIANDQEDGIVSMEALGKICNASCGTGLSVRHYQHPNIRPAP